MSKTSKPESLSDKRIKQIVGILGDGCLVDGGQTSREFRDFLRDVRDSSFLTRYVRECLEDSFENSGLVLQDLINEVGFRLGFKVEHGRYQGTKKDLGWDGIWEANDKTFIIEVKTTDAYSLRLDQINKYKAEIVSKRDLNNKNTFILIVTGRKWFVDAASVEIFRAKLHSEPSVPELAVKNELISQKASETPSPLTLQSLACYRLSLECFSLP